MTSKGLAVITGATSGIGAAMARKLAAMGYDLLLTGRRMDVLAAVAEDIRRAHGVAVRCHHAELSTDDGAHALATMLRELDVEVLVNNAGFGASSRYPSCDPQQMAALARLNVLTPLALTDAVLPAMVRRHCGGIINVASEGIYLPIPANAVYSGVKSFLKTWTEGLHQDLRGTGVRVLAVCPGLTRSDFHPRMGLPQSRMVDRGPLRWMQPEQVAEATIKAWQRGHVVCVPGIHTRVLIAAMNLLPHRGRLNVLYRFSQKAFSSSSQPPVASAGSQPNT